MRIVAKGPRRLDRLVLQPLIRSLSREILTKDMVSNADLDEMFHALMQSWVRREGLSRALRARALCATGPCVGASEIDAPVDERQIRIHEQLTEAWRDAVDRHADLLKLFFDLCQEPGEAVVRARRQDGYGQRLNQGHRES